MQAAKLAERYSLVNGEPGYITVPCTIMHLKYYTYINTGYIDSAHIHTQNTNMCIVMLLAVKCLKHALFLVYAPYIFPKSPPSKVDSVHMHSRIHICIYMYIRMLILYSERRIIIVKYLKHALF